MIESVKDSYNAEYPELNELFNQVRQSLQNLELHFQKEENVLFPYLYILFEASQNEQMMVELETFVEHLFEHIFIENNILFPLFEKLEREWVR